MTKKKDKKEKQNVENKDNISFTCDWSSAQSNVLT